MIDPQQQRRFVELRAQGWSFAKIAAETGIAKRTLINLSRKLQFEIQNERSVELERIQHEFVSSPEDRARIAGAELNRVLDELKTRDLSKVSTSRLYSLADSFRRQVLHETGRIRFTSPVREIPADERIDKVQDWSA